MSLNKRPGRVHWKSGTSFSEQAEPLGPEDIDQAIETHDLDNLRKAFGNRSANTVLRRGNSMVRFLKLFQKARFSACPFPVFESDIEEYLNHLQGS